MNLKILTDQQLLSDTQSLVKAERELLTKVLSHLKEIERRRLYSELGYQSLFDYAVRHLNYSEGQAGRRIQALRLIKEFPEVEQKIESGALNLTNISQAQSFFREQGSTLNDEKKRDVLQMLEFKSSREGEKKLFEIFPEKPKVKERERMINEDLSEVKFVMTKELREKVETLRSLLGVKGATMSFGELVDAMVDISIESASAKKFGKKRVEAEKHAEDEDASAVVSSVSSKSERYISQAVKHAVWKRDGGSCCRCKGKRNLQIDHVVPVAMGGKTEMDNLRLLCFSCNQRAAINVFGVEKVTFSQGLGSH